MFRGNTTLAVLDLCRKEHTETNQEKLPPLGIEPGILVFYSDAFLTELTLQMLIEGYLTSLLYVDQLLTFGLRLFS